MSQEQEEPLAPGHVEEPKERNSLGGAEPARARYNAAPNPGTYRGAAAPVEA